MQQLVFLVIAALLLLGGVRYLFKKFGKFQRTPISVIADVKSGDVVKVQGRAVLFGEIIKAPFTNRKCVYYVAEVHRYRGRWNSRGNYRWSAEDAWVEEGSVEMMGTVIIHSAGSYAVLDTVKVRSDIHKDKSYVVGTMHAQSPAMVRFVKENRINPKDFIGVEKSLRWSEGIIEKGEECVMMGVGTWKTPEECGLKIDAEKIVVITDIPGDYAYITDRV